MRYQIRLARKAEKALEGVDRPTEQRLPARMHELTENPYDPRISKWLVAAPGKRSSRVGNWRIIYTVQKKDQAVEVLFIEPRGEAYKRL